MSLESIVDPEKEQEEVELRKMLKSPTWYTIFQNIAMAIGGHAS